MKLLKLESIINLGIDFTIAESEKRRIKLSNILNLFFIITNVFYTLILYLMSISEYSVMLYIGEIIYLLCLYLNKLGKHNFSRNLMMTISTSTVLYYSIVMGKSSSVYVIFISFGAFPFVLFDVKEKFSLLYGLSLGPIGFIIVELCDKFLKQTPPLPENYLYILSFNLFFTTFLIVLLIVYNFESLSRRAEIALRQAKEQQDGDYFLTSLIVQPLFRNPDSNDSIQTEYFAKQKKTFSFQKKSRDLGGDINIIGKLNFRGNDYTLVVNADAMGKSMQGAGGAIVMGTVVNSILTRNKGIRIPMHPKEWLIKMFRELQDVFVEFDGSMLILA